MELPRKYWRPCLVIVDEAHIYCGQQEKQESTHSVIDLMTRGRKRGYCGILATQRIAKLHKDAAAEANNYMVGRTGLDVDMKRAAEILGFTSRDDMLSLRNLEPGEFYVFGTAISRNVQKAKVGKVETTHPKVGMDLRGRITPPTPKIKAILAELNNLPKEAEEKARTIEEANKRIRELERQIKKLPITKQLTAGVDQKQLEIARQKGFDEADKKYKARLNAIEKNNQLLIRKLNQIGQLAEFKGIDVDNKPEPKYPKRIIFPLKTDTSHLANVKSDNFYTPDFIPKTDDDNKLNRCERSILSLLYNTPQREFKKALIGVFTGYSHKSGGFNNAICKLNAMGLIQRNNAIISLSEEGSISGAELLGNDVNLYETFTIANWEKNLPKCEGRIFRFLMDNPQMEFTKEELGEQTDYQAGSGGFNNAICRLNSLALIKRQNGMIKLNEEILEL
jgi:hypothetical protein